MQKQLFFEKLKVSKFGLKFCIKIWYLKMAYLKGLKSWILNIMAKKNCGSWK
jgi:hypothetical protein